ncbi:thioredoxin [Pseudomonas sp. PA15(2017)]|uniref:thioredoxin family protein n=1 Tax=Pseudomonas sp. PA15(2017) TaxID=1932111 RepID=UPI00095D165D|nr:thioredoxin family protein [Pseudomonas sp. PA15(2017)]OLU29027.1 thioredoxin [Pseudomonas sp. PA15(2017)]
MTDHLSCHQNDIALASIAMQLELTDFDADRRLLDLPGASLVIFTSQGCASCRYARQQLAQMELPVQRLVWIDAGENSGLVQRYEVFQLPALFVVCDGEFLGALHARLSAVELRHALLEALARAPEDLP